MSKAPHKRAEPWVYMLVTGLYLLACAFAFTL